LRGEKVNDLEFDLESKFSKLFVGQIEFFKRNASFLLHYSNSIPQEFFKTL